jgi:hypothetical protein
MNTLSRLIVALVMLATWHCWAQPIVSTALRTHRAQHHAQAGSPREAPMVRAIWAQVPAAFKSAAIERAAERTAPPLSHDSRYVNPETRALIAAIIEHYGFDEHPHDDTSPPAPKAHMSAEQTLRATQSAVEAGELSPTEAAVVLALTRRLAAEQLSGR